MNHTDNKPGIVCEPDIAKQNAALRECVVYARSKRGKDFDFDTWEAMCAAAMSGEHAPSALENEIALHAQTRDALIAVRKERDALLVDTCRGASCGKCLCCRAWAAGATDSASTAAPRERAPRKTSKRPPPGDAVHVYTDGACTGNPGPMGIGIVIFDGPDRSAAARREISQYLGQGTNNIAELTAIEVGLASLTRDRSVVVYSDSSYAIGLLAQGWRARANQELVARLRALLQEFPHVAFVKVAGHSGHPENERCDELARTAIVKRSSSRHEHR